MDTVLNASASIDFTLVDIYRCIFLVFLPSGNNMFEETHFSVVGSRPQPSLQFQIESELFNCLSQLIGCFYRKLTIHLRSSKINVFFFFWKIKGTSLGHFLKTTNIKQQVEPHHTSLKLSSIELFSVQNCMCVQKYVWTLTLAQNLTILWDVWDDWDVYSPV